LRTIAQWLQDGFEHASAPISMTTSAKAFLPPRLPLQTPLASAAAVALALVLVAVAAQRALALSLAFPATAAALFAVVAVGVVALADRHLAAPAFGVANGITLARAGLVAIVAALAGEPLSEPVLWFAVGVAIVAVSLDGVDGCVARHRGESSAFGARFDMEIDALSILSLTLLAWQSGRAGVWVIAGGLLRYAFVAAARVQPWLAAPLPPRRRRQTACIVQIVALIVCIAPIVPSVLAGATALVGLTVLTASFATDVFWLARRR
jgi:phosphatidylglycerophosphate synthase